ncbi:hypothetical protein CEUSTIGMA_g2132.t1 [Chlamydomonas eustigma]|uniref:Uncharacterized protein n=1 Tax=Chlamydomonas eustigma TaxID=1157962 RepID=A0A250WV14_9CHLO|nr:hypothetical protein CEUSTIGMA_g2132.t1 [Chlamydomonas eustigma]|eukprot:GAX74684.1 hypothetical protein CEUSTIGMA_g2132.t1 [Chlamydomonas eustigma]
MLNGLEGLGQKGPHLHALRRNNSTHVIRKITVSARSNKDGKDKGDSQGKADFSAYWSLKIREFFSNRKKVLEDMERKGVQEPELVRKLQAQLEEEMEGMRAQQEEERKALKLKMAAQKELEIQKARDSGITDEQMDALAAQDKSYGEHDVKNAREEMRKSAVSGLAVNMMRARQLIKAALLAPITLALSIQKQWSALFQSQRYENFLLSEGEKIWYWRNRTENERWFWELVFWDRLLFPFICAYTYQQLVPNHLIWAVVVPATFILFQSGELPGPWGVEFWYIAYFGFYQKCWPEVSSWLATIARPWTF